MKLKKLKNGVEIQHYEEKAEQAEQKAKAELLETITKILK